MLAKSQTDKSSNVVYLQFHFQVTRGEQIMADASYKNYKQLQIPMILLLYHCTLCKTNCPLPSAKNSDDLDQLVKIKLLKVDDLYQTLSHAMLWLKLNFYNS